MLLLSYQEQAQSVYRRRLVTVHQRYTPTHHGQLTNVINSYCRSVYLSTNLVVGV